MKRIISITFILLPLCLFSQNDTVIDVNQHNNIVENLHARIYELKNKNTVLSESIDSIGKSYEERLKNINKSHMKAIDSINKYYGDIQESLKRLIDSRESDSVEISKMKERVNQMDLSEKHYKDTIAEYRSDISIKSKQIDSLSYIIQNQSVKFDNMTIEMIRTGLYTKCDSVKIASLRNDFANISDVKIKNDNKEFDEVLAIYTKTLKKLITIVSNCYIGTKGYDKYEQDTCIKNCKESIDNLYYKKTYYLEDYFTSPYLNAKIDNVRDYLEEIKDTKSDERNELIDGLLELKSDLE